ncbi:MAG TPA: ATP-binding protein [Methanocorpusculum sp.]|nr:ATP-binding protein [Methanocorpusculum sp.]
MAAAPMIDRPVYLDKLIRKKEDGFIKIITGMRRTGKSYLLFRIYHQYLLSTGVDEAHIIELSLEDDTAIAYRNPLNLGTYIRSRITDDRMYYIILDEIQKVSAVPNPYVPDGDPITFVDVLLGLMKIRNADIYVTGSNSRMLSSDILTEFRGRGEEIRMYPLSYREFLSAYQGDRKGAWTEYYTYGGLPLILFQRTHEDKSQYLLSLFDTIYMNDILSRYSIGYDKTVLDDLLNIVASSIGSLTSPLKLSHVFTTEKKHPITDDTVAKYLDYFADAFILSKAQRYNVKGKKYISSPAKYYYADLGLRNARLNFLQQELTHIMENIIYNELLVRGFSVDVGIVEWYGKEDGKTVRKTLEVDFVADKGSTRYYIQSALSVSDPAKLRQETGSLTGIADSFRKIVVVSEPVVPWHDDSGILYIGVEQFLLDDGAMDL